MTTAPLLRVEGLDVSYGRVRVLHGVHLEVAAGEIVALLGTNGAGKSTILRAVSGLLPPDAGRVELAGEDVTGAHPSTLVRRGIVQMPGGRATFPGLTVRENLRIGALALPKPQRAARVEATIERFGWLATRLDDLAGSLSGGQQQLLALARALVTEPRVLLVDELSLGLAPVVVAELLDTLSMLREQGAAVVVVEQQVDLALSVADRAYFLERGTIRFDGPAHELQGRTDLLRAIFLSGAPA